MEYSLVISIGALLGVILTGVKLISYITTKAREEGSRDQVMKDIIKDSEGIGRKLSAVESEQRRTSEKVIELESKIVTKLDNIENLLVRHLDNHREEKNNGHL